MADKSYGQHLIDVGTSDFAEDLHSSFTLAMDYIIKHIAKPEPEIVRAAFATAPLEILEYFAQDKWFQIVKKQSDVPIYSQIAREILIERVVLGGTERK